MNVPFCHTQRRLSSLFLSILLLLALDSALCQVLRVFAWDAVVLLCPLWRLHCRSAIHLSTTWVFVPALDRSVHTLWTLLVGMHFRHSFLNRLFFSLANWKWYLTTIWQQPSYFHISWKFPKCFFWNKNIFFVKRETLNLPECFQLVEMKIFKFN